MTPAPISVDTGVLQAVAAGAFHQPHAVLGPHPGPGGVTIRTLRPLADEVTIVTKHGRVPATHEQAGIWLAFLPNSFLAGDDAEAPAGKAKAKTAKSKAGTTKAGTAKAGAAKAGTAKAGTAKSGTAKVSAAAAGSQKKTTAKAAVTDAGASPAGPGPAQPAALDPGAVPAKVPDYRVEVRYGDEVTVSDDPYRFLPTLGELDLHLIATGRHEELWRALGANVRSFPSELGEVHGTSFAVWAPAARAVRVVGDFNQWTSGATAMRSLGASGVWEIFVPGAGPGTRYKYEIQTPDGSWIMKADPMARATEVPPATASIVTEARHTWRDEAWMKRRAERNPHTGPLSVYEVHLGSWRQGLGYRELAEQLTAYVTDLGFTHVEFLPVAEHPFGGSWGYQVTSYYAPTARFGHPDDFRYLVDTLHQAGIGVIVDWVPAHFPKDSFALARFDGTALYEYPDAARAEHPDWGTYVFNYGRTEVRNFLVANACYWFEEFHIDGLRVDAVASMLYLDYSRTDGQWVPNAYGGRENLEAISFLQETNATAYKRYPGIMMIAEESTAWAGVTAPTNVGGLGFGLKWNMGWMNDTLRYLLEDPVNRHYHHNKITFSLVYAFSENFILPLSHDEVVHGKGSLLRKMPGDRWKQLAGLRALFAYQWSHPGKQLLFMGSEFAQEAEWTESRSLDWWLTDQRDHAAVQDLVRDLNRIYHEHEALWAEDFDSNGFEWIDADDADHNLLVFVRKSPGGDRIVVVINFGGVPVEAYRLALPGGGTWLELLNTDSEYYGGSGVGNLGEITAEPIPFKGREFSASIRVPPLGALWFTPKK